MHEYFGQLKERCACFSSKIYLGAIERKRSSRRICFDGPQVCSFGNNVFITER